MKLHIVLGRLGDIVNVLPLLYSDSLKGENPRLMVAKEYAHILDGVSYVRGVIFEGHHKDIVKAVEQAKQMGFEPVVMQVVGSTEDINNTVYANAPKGMATSFQKESWRLAGRLKEWDDNLPLVFDKRDAVREAELLKANGFSNKGRKKPVMLLALDSGSSPFPHVELLRELLVAKYSFKYRIIDLPKAERFYDLLALYEQSEILVAVDSAPLHLAWGCRKIPVFVLAQDKPMLWHGSPWRPNHYWYCRYSDFPNRAIGLLKAIDTIDLRIDEPELIQVWSEYDDEKPITEWGNMLPVSLGMCGRDSVNCLKHQYPAPYLKDVIRMAMQRVLNDDAWIILQRPKTQVELLEKITEHPPFYAYRMVHDENGYEFRPVVDLFCAKKGWWRELLKDMPDLLLAKDFNWSQCLWAMFKERGASDQTGICYRNRTEPKTGAESEASKYNADLCTKYISTSKVRSRFPAVHNQHECVPLDSTKLPPFAYNASVIRQGDKTWMSYRFHEGGSNTKLGVCDITAKGIENPKVIELGGASNEDARLFMLQGEARISWVESNFLGQPDAKSVIKYGTMGHDGKVSDVKQVKAGSNDWSSMQKNWVFFQSDENLFAIYTSHPEQIVMQIQGETVINEYKTPKPVWPYGSIRGGSVVPYEGKLLRFFHSRLENEIGAVKHRYYVGALLMNSKPPFEVLSVSHKPILYGSEIDALKGAERRACHHWKANVVFPCGAETIQGGWLLAVGVNDSAVELVKLERKDLNL